MSRRRQRFTVKLADGTRRVILAYTAPEAERYYAQRGLQVKSVLKGDYRKVAWPVTGIRPNQAALKEAADMLGLKHPVAVRTSSRRGGVHGRCASAPTGGDVIRSGTSLMFADTATGWCHEIMVKSYLSAEEMGRTLWHELAHAMQFERDILSLGLLPSESLKRWHRSYSDGTSYSRKPAEVEAREHESLNDDHPLAR